MKGGITHRDNAPSQAKRKVLLENLKIDIFSLVRIILGLSDVPSGFDVSGKSETQIRKHGHTPRLKRFKKHKGLSVSFFQRKQI